MSLYNCLGKTILYHNRLTKAGVTELWRPLTSENAFEVQIHGAQKKHLPVSDLTVTNTVWACALGLLGLSGDVQQRVGVKLKSLALAQTQSTSPKAKPWAKAFH